MFYYRMHITSDRHQKRDGEFDEDVEWVEEKDFPAKCMWDKERRILLKAVASYKGANNND